MPTYQYACTECEHAFEQVQSFSEDSLTDCPQCEGRLRKIFNAVGVVFKGSGFYRTDSRASTDPGSGKSTEASSTSTPATPATSTEPASATAKPAKPAKSEAGAA